MSKLDILEKEIKPDLRLSYSRVSAFAKNGPKELNDETRTKLDNKGTRYGSIVDLLEQNASLFKEQYHIFDGEKPTATLGKLVDFVLKNIPKEDWNVKEFASIANELNLWSNIKKYDTLVAKFDTHEFWDYIKTIKKCEEKNLEIVTRQDYLDARETVESLKTNNFTKHIFNNQDENIEIVNQFELNFEYNDFKFKSFLDKIIINHKEKTFRLLDLKTGADSAYKFPGTFVKYKYYLQESIYSQGADTIAKELGIEGYKILPFQFVYIQRNVNKPIIFEVSNKWHNAALNGFKLNGYNYKGLNELLKDIYWHWINKAFDLSRELIENNGVLILKDDNI